MPDELDSLPEYMGPDPHARAVLSEVDDHLLLRRFTGRSPDGAVTAVVNGRCTLLDLAVDDAALRRGHVDTVGRAVVAAVTAARATAARTATEFVTAALDPSRPDPDLSLPTPPPAAAPPRPPAPPPSAPQPRSQVAEDEEFGAAITAPASARPDRPPARPEPRTAPQRDDDGDAFRGFGEDGGSW